MDVNPLRPPRSKLILRCSELVGITRLESAARTVTDAADARKCRGCAEIALRRQ
jgi:hypothetical protein